ncbi:carboxylesterase/lipase family protein [Streptomyces fulvoviolaceus]|uniref:carboxylesterase/lipase family protein n=1 Tax=Streptomyces fulvoviolaceus TaxID=285535 RepID=UPI0004C88000|nr:carboxylesterase family protein [Streptomyces fulvoviolaceus]MCT9077328.1 carboxylesterase family protein [Streptomyces fulvoviolaceus]
MRAITALRGRVRATLATVSLLGLGVTPVVAQSAQSGDAPARSASTVVQTTDGKVRGAHTTDYDEWLGIPYAADPAGANRWKPPQPVTKWSGVRDATAFSNRCAQNSGWDPGYENTVTSEDCLALNVYVPDGARAKTPVLVWIHGGGFTGGAGQDTNPRRFVEQTGAVVVTVNYRLGVLGTLNLPQLQAESKDGPGNYGLLDQQAALRWVHSNIARFGGDPKNVTIAGQSAGAGSVCDHLASPTAKGLFARAGILSGGCNLQSAASGQAQSEAFVKAVGCDTSSQVVACLRAKPAADLLAAQKKAGVSLSLGGSAFPVNPATAVQTGAINRVPVMLGQTNSERGLFTFQNYDYLGTPMTAAGYETAVRSAYGANADKVLAAYPLSAYDTPGEAFTAAQNGSTSYTRQQLMGALSKWVPTYAYEFAESDTPHFTSIFLIQQKSESARDFPFGGAIHVDDLGYLWDYLGQTLPYDDDQLELSHQMITYWGRFAVNGNPNGARTPAWPKYSVRTGKLMSLVACDTSPASGRAPAACSKATDTFDEEHNLDFWASLPS